MSEFYNRVSVQRDVIKIVNKTALFSFPLNGLTQESIKSWIDLNKVENERIINIIYHISEKMMLLANKSQEQITEEYSLLSYDVAQDMLRLKEGLKLLENNDARN